MKLDARRLPAFLKDPGACRVVLLYGDDDGLIRARAEALTRAVVGAADDPFRVAWLGRDELDRLSEEAGAIALTGGRRVVRVREVGEPALPVLRRAVAGRGDALLVLEAPGLASRSRLRAFVEEMWDGAVIGCYAEEGSALAATIRTTLAAAGVTAETEALDWLAAHLGADRAVTVAEVEKAALYVGQGGRLDLEAAQACVGDAASLSIDDALFAATAGDLAGLDRALVLAFAEGAAPVGVLRAAMLHLQRLHRARLAVDGGAAPAEATRQARPPVFFRRTAAFTAALSAWNSGGLLAALEALSDAEAACKQTGSPDVVLCQRALARIAAQAGRGRR